MLTIRIMDEFVTIAKAKALLGVSTTTLRRWEASGRLIPTCTVGNQHRYSLQALDPSVADSIESPRKTYAYARVSSHDQKEALARQAQVLEIHCAAQDWTFEIITDLETA